MLEAFRESRDIDLSGFVRSLRSHGVPFRVAEEGEDQVIYVPGTLEQQAVIELYRRFQATGEPEPVAPMPMRPRFNWRVLFATPMTATLILANVIGFPITLGSEQGSFSEWFRLFSLLDFQVQGDQIYFANLAYSVNSGQWWRLVTPMFLHFGWLHIVFNLLWTWEFGRRIERMLGGLTLLLLVLFSSVAANLTQYYLSGAGLFGGMSGVVFGFVGFGFIWSRLVPQRPLGLPPGLYMVLIGFLVLGFTGAFDLLGLGSLANGAHLGGFLAGVVFAFVCRTFLSARRSL